MKLIFLLILLLILLAFAAHRQLTTKQRIWIVEKWVIVRSQREVVRQFNQYFN
jgi:hypothetical protein